jgi:hypothetical protein
MGISDIPVLNGGFAPIEQELTIDLTDVRGRIGISNGLWKPVGSPTVTHGWPIDAVLEGLELASALLSCRDWTGPFGSIVVRLGPAASEHQG